MSHSCKIGTISSSRDNYRHRRALSHPNLRSRRRPVSMLKCSSSHRHATKHLQHSRRVRTDASRSTMNSKTVSCLRSTISALRTRETHQDRNHPCSPYHRSRTSAATRLMNPFYRSSKLRPWSIGYQVSNRPVSPMNLRWARRRHVIHIQTGVLQALIPTKLNQTM